jgi:hypothetical protein
MPKSRRRKKPRKEIGNVGMTAEERQILLHQREAFIAKFGREPEDGDLVIFDPTKDIPTPVDLEIEVLGWELRNLGHEPLDQRALPAPRGAMSTGFGAAHAARGLLPGRSRV